MTSHRSSIPLDDAADAVQEVAEKLRRALEQERRTFNLAMMASQMGTWRYTLADNICTYDENAQRLYGLTQARFLHDEDGVKAKFHADDLALMWERVGKALDPQGDGHYDVEYRVKQLDGSWRWLSAWGLVEFEGEGAEKKPVAIVGASRDLTEHKRTKELEELLQRAQLAHVTRVSLMGELAASLAHELSQPLTAILANATAVSRYLDQGAAVNMQDMRAALQDLIADQGRAAEIVRHIRTHVRKEAMTAFVAIDVALMVQDTLALAQTEATLHGVQIVSLLEPDLPPVSGDRVQLQQVLLNLLLNALDAIKKSDSTLRTVTVLAQFRDGMVRVTVRDQGGGVASGDMERMFEPFYTTKLEGLGMGLSICRSIVHAHGGGLWAENNAGGGATFSFTVPVAGALP